MEGTIASRSNPWVVKSSAFTTFRQPMRALKQSTTRVGLKSTNATIVARYSRVRRRTFSSNNVWRIHEIQYRSNAVVCLSELCCGVETMPSNRMYSPRARDTKVQTTARLRRKASAANARGTSRRVSFKKGMIWFLDHQGR